MIGYLLIMNVILANPRRTIMVLKQKIICGSYLYIKTNLVFFLIAIMFTIISLYTTFTTVIIGLLNHQFIIIGLIYCFLSFVWALLTGRLFLIHTLVKDIQRS